MPKATSNIEEKHRLELKTLEGGWVEARRLTYGEKLHRRAMVSMKLTGDSKKKDDFAGEMALANEQASLFDFEKCILDHNLYRDDEETQKLNLNTVQDVRVLDPRVGEEISNWLDELNNFEADEGN